MKAFINNNVQLWFQKDEDSNPLFVCEDVTDVDAVANYLVALRMVREPDVLDADGSDSNR